MSGFYCNLTALEMGIKKMHELHNIMNRVKTASDSLLFQAEFVEGTGYETRQTSKRNLFVRVLT